MKRLVVCLALTGPALAQHPWEKNPEQWSDADTKRILADSPWAKPARIQVRNGAPGAAGFQLNSSALSPQSSRITVRFESALPIRLALLKAGIVPAADPHSADWTVVVQLPSRWDRYVPLAGDWHDARAWILPAGASNIQFLGVRLIEETDDMAALVFTFSRSDSLTAARYARLPFWKRNLKTIEFNARVGALLLKQRFSVPAMVYRGQFEL